MSSLRDWGMGVESRMRGVGDTRTDQCSRFAFIGVIRGLFLVFVRFGVGDPRAAPGPGQIGRCGVGDPRIAMDPGTAVGGGRYAAGTVLGRSRLWWFISH